MLHILNRVTHLQGNIIQYYYPHNAFAATSFRECEAVGTYLPSACMELYYLEDMVLAIEETTGEINELCEC